MNILRYDTPSEEFNNYTDKPIIFLAGPTVRGNQLHLISWRFEAIQLFESLGFNGTLIIPEFQELTESDQYRYDLPDWEYKGLNISDCNLFWVPRTRELIGLTTNHEHGFWIARDFKKVIYGRPDDAYRMKYLDIMFDKLSEEHGFHTEIWNTLEDTIKAAISRAYKRHDLKI